MAAPNAEVLATSATLEGSGTGWDGGRLTATEPAPAPENGFERNVPVTNNELRTNSESRLFANVSDSLGKTKLGTSRNECGRGFGPITAEEKWSGGMDW